MKRISAFAIGLAILAGPVAAPVIATADPGARSMDYQQATDVVIARGLSQRGVPFSWGGGGVNGPSRGTGTGINTVGFDASGLMQYAYAGAGIKLPRSSGAIYRAGQKILPQQAHKGDLICYGPDGTQSVAMYLGNNQMLEVGDVVQVSPVRANGMTPYLVRVLGAQSAALPQAPAQQVPTQQLPGQQVPTQQLPGQQAPVQQSPLAPAQQSPLQQAPAQQSPLAPAQQSPLQQAPVQQSPLAPAQQSPLQQAPVQQAPLAPAQQSPLQQAPVQQSPLAPAQQSPLAPAQQSPFQQAPAQQALLQPLPAQQAPLQGATR